MKMGSGPTTRRAVRLVRSWQLNSPAEINEAELKIGIKPDREQSVLKAWHAASEG